MEFSIIIAFFTVFLFGLRHGLDNDHIAAIFSITSAVKKDKNNKNNHIEQFSNAFSYIFGHASIVILLGLLILFVGFSLPISIDTIFERIIGISLILLGIYVLYSVALHYFKKENIKLKSRVEFMHFFLISIYVKITAFFSKGNKSVKTMNVSPFILGIIHGIGAETPSQLLLLIVVGGLQGTYGIIALALFVIGLLISNTLLSIASIKINSLSNAEKYSIVIAAASGIFSLILGIMVFV